jgi:hypothetical protein
MDIPRELFIDELNRVIGGMNAPYDLPDLDSGLSTPEKGEDMSPGLPSESLSGIEI